MRENAGQPTDPSAIMTLMATQAKRSYGTGHVYEKHWSAPGSADTVIYP